MNHISVGFSIHRPEIVPVTARIMAQHDAIFLEEPPEAGMIHFYLWQQLWRKLNRDSTPFFHLTDEIDCTRTARMLCLRDCRILYTVIRHAVTKKARLAAADYIKTHYHKHVLL